MYLPTDHTRLPHHGRVDSEVSSDQLDALLRDITELPSGPRRAALRQEAIQLLLPLARRVAGRFRNRGEDLDDLVQVACLGVVKAVDGYDPTLGHAFLSYAVPTVTGEIKRHLRDRTSAVRMPRPLHDARGQVFQAVEELEQRLGGRAPTVEQIAEHTGLEPERVLSTLRAVRECSPRSLEAPSDNEEGASLVSVTGSEDPALGLVTDTVALASLVERLPERDRRVLYLRFYRERTQQQIADTIGVSQMQVSRILARCLAQLRSELLAPEPPARVQRSAPRRTTSRDRLARCDHRPSVSTRPPTASVDRRRCDTGRTSKGSPRAMAKRPPATVCPRRGATAAHRRKAAGRTRPFPASSGAPRPTPTASGARCRFCVLCRLLPLMSRCGGKLPRSPLGARQERARPPAAGPARPPPALRASADRDACVLGPPAWACSASPPPACPGAARAARRFGEERTVNPRGPLRDMGDPVRKRKKDAEKAEIHRLQLCDLCAATFAEDRAVRGYVPDSSCVHPVNDWFDGLRLLIACSDEHFGALKETYRSRPFVQEELWAAKITRALTSGHPALTLEQLGFRTGLHEVQIRRAIAWSNERRRRRPDGTV